MHADETLRVEGAAHIVDIGFAGSVESCKVASSECIEGPGKLVLRVVSEEGLVGFLRAFVLFVDVRSLGIQGWWLFETVLVHTVDRGGMEDAGWKIIWKGGSGTAAKGENREGS